MKLPLGFWILLTTFWAVAPNVSAAAELPPISLWSGRPPAEINAFPAEADTTKPGDDLVAGRLGYPPVDTSDQTSCCPKCISIPTADTVTVFAAPNMTSPPGRIGSPTG